VRKARPHSLSPQQLLHASSSAIELGLLIQEIGRSIPGSRPRYLRLREQHSIASDQIIVLSPKRSLWVGVP
jgi:hypothetical protein